MIVTSYLLERFDGWGELKRLTPLFLSFPTDRINKSKIEMKRKNLNEKNKSKRYLNKTEIKRIKNQ